MTVDNALLLGQVAFLVALYLFLLILALLLRRELRARASVEEERAPADLLVVEPGETGLVVGERVPLLALSVVGRGDDTDVHLPDIGVSTEHAKLFWNGKGWVLQDLESTNGTRVNGKQVTRAVAVKPGDVLEFGRVKMKLVQT